MTTTYDVMNAVMEEYFRLYELGKFQDSEWDDSELEYQFSLPFPSDFTLKVTTYSDYSGEDDHFVVTILNRANQEVTGFEGPDNAIECETLEYVVYQALNNLCSMPWYEYHAEKAWQEFLKIPVAADGTIQEGFLKFNKGDRKAEVLDWFGKIYRHGIAPLIDPPGPGEQISTYRIPLEWKCRGYLDVSAKSIASALKFIESGRYELPEGEVIPGSVHVDSFSEISAVPPKKHD